MNTQLASAVPKWILARIFCFPALLMPYRIRMGYIQTLSICMHLPFKAFGRLARIILEKLEIEAAQDPPDKTRVSSHFIPATPDRQHGSVAVLYSGGTDSTCAVALMAQRFSEVHLLIYHEHSTRNSPIPSRNIELLRAHFPAVIFKVQVLSVDRLVRYFSYNQYLRNIFKFRLLVLATCGFSSLSWHVRTLAYCLENKITHVSDGLTKELMHFPGHMDEVVGQFRELYKSYGISYENPVRNWPTPEDQQFIDKVLVNVHGGDFFLGDSHVAQRKTTGWYLFELGIFPSANVKGSKLDFLMQHDCYPFALYNIMAFWGYLTVEPYPVFCQRIAQIMESKMVVAKALLDEYLQAPEHARFTALLEHE